MARERLVKNPVVERANTLVSAAMSAGFFSPLFLFWGAALGPLRPFHYPPPPVEPSIGWMAAGLVVCFAPLLLSSSYYRPSASGVTRRWYEAIGVRWFKALATNGDLINRWGRRHDPGYRKVATAASLTEFESATRSGERFHLVLLLVGLVSALFAVRLGWYGWAAGLTIGNVVFNLYPVLLQRYNRGRVQRMHGRRVRLIAERRS